MWFKDSKLADAYESITESENSKGHLLSKCDAEFWYVTLRQTLSAFQNSGGGVVCLYRIRRRGLLGRRIMGERICKANLVHYSEKREMLLGDIVSEAGNKGYGSAVMENVIKLCRQLRVKSISGEISERDSGHLDKLKHFYAKHGFNLTMYKQGESRGMIGKVELELSDYSGS